MQIGVCSYSFHRLLKDGKQDVFGYISTARQLGCTHLDLWNAHLPAIANGVGPLNADDRQYLARVRAAAADARLPFASLAVDGAHIYEPHPADRAMRRNRAHRHLQAAVALGAHQLRIDAGGPADPTPDVFEIIEAGYRDLVDRAAAEGVQILVENHWGPTNHPDHVCRLLDSVPGLGLLFDSHNWRPETRDAARKRCAPRAAAVHLKSFTWDNQGNETSEENLPAVIDLLKQSNYQGVWSIESVPKELDELTAAKNAVALLKRSLA